MIGPGAPWRPSTVPPWLAAILTVGAVLLMISALPMLAAAITPDRGSPAAPGSVPPSPVPLPGVLVSDRTVGAAPPSPLPLGARPDPDRPDPDRPGPDAGAPVDVRGLPGAGGNSASALATALVLLSAGLGMLKMVGFSGERPWPGRYVRRGG